MKNEINVVKLIMVGKIDLAFKLAKSFKTSLKSISNNIAYILGCPHPKHYDDGSLKHWLKMELDNPRRYCVIGKFRPKILKEYSQFFKCMCIDMAGVSSDEFKSISDIILPKKVKWIKVGSDIDVQHFLELNPHIKVLKS